MIPKYEDMASINNISAELAYKFAVFYDKIAALEIQNEQLTKERDELVKNSYEFNKTLTELRQCVETLTKERDEARREVCNASFDDPRDCAAQRGWDCFKDYK